MVTSSSGSMVKYKIGIVTLNLKQRSCCTMQNDWIMVPVQVKPLYSPYMFLLVLYHLAVEIAPLQGQALQ